MQTNIAKVIRTPRSKPPGCSQRHGDDNSKRKSNNEDVKADSNPIPAIHDNEINILAYSYNPVSVLTEDAICKDL